MTETLLTQLPEPHRTFWETGLVSFPGRRTRHWSAN